ncbi:hypothetical protein ACFY9N_14060 [Microbacterium sp. NPDC008134]
MDGAPTRRWAAAFFVALIPLIGTLILLELLARASKPEGARFDVPPALNH